MTLSLFSTGSPTVGSGIQVYFEEHRSYFLGRIDAQNIPPLVAKEQWKVVFCDGTIDWVLPEEREWMPVRSEGNSREMERVSLLDGKITIEDELKTGSLWERHGRVKYVEESGRGLWAKVHWEVKVGLDYKEKPSHYAKSPKYADEREYNINLAEINYKIIGGGTSPGGRRDRSQRGLASPSVTRETPVKTAKTPGGSMSSAASDHTVTTASKLNKLTPGSVAKQKKKEKREKEVARLQDSLSQGFETGTRNGQKKEPLPKELEANNEGYNKVGLCCHVTWKDGQEYAGCVSAYNVVKKKWRVHTYDGEREWYVIDGSESPWLISVLCEEVTLTLTLTLILTPTLEPTI